MRNPINISRIHQLVHEHRKPGTMLPQLCVLGQVSNLSVFLPVPLGAGSSDDHYSGRIREGRGQSRTLRCGGAAPAPPETGWDLSQEVPLVLEQWDIIKVFQGGGSVVPQTQGPLMPSACPCSSSDIPLYLPDTQARA